MKTEYLAALMQHLPAEATGILKVRVEEQLDVGLEMMLLTIEQFNDKEPLDKQLLALGEFVRSLVSEGESLGEHRANHAMASVLVCLLELAPIRALLRSMTALQLKEALSTQAKENHRLAKSKLDLLFLAATPPAGEA
jgi:hypothetical protein